MRRPFGTCPPTVISLCLVLVATLSLSCCDRLSTLLGITDSFAGYRDSTVDLIAAHPLSSQDLSSAGYQSNASWTWAWRGSMDAGTFDYMTLTPIGTVGSGAPAGLAAGATAYRVELVNLYPSGDFESVVGTPPSPPWAASAGTPFSVATGPGGINGSQALAISTNANANVSFDVSKASDQPGTSIHQYDILFEGKAGSFAYMSGVAADYSKASALVILPTSAMAVRIPQLSLPVGSSWYLFFGSTSPLVFTMDDLRLIRSDIGSSYRLRLLLLPTDTTPTLRSGYYEFTVWVRKATGRYFVTESSATQPYAASSVTLSMKTLQPNPSGPETAFAVEAVGAWTQLSLKMDPGANFTLDSASTAAVVELSIAPFDFNQPSPGQVEIADPQLHFYLNNY
jgi:hypothetical protein